MIVRKPVEVDIRIDDSRTLHLLEEIELSIDGREAAAAILGEDVPVSEQDMKYLLNRLAAFLKGVPDERIANMSASQRLTIFSFLNDQAKRFHP